MYPGVHAQQCPEKPAVIMAQSGTQLTYRELDERSNQLARLLRSAGLQRADRVAFVLENRPELLVCAWAAQRSGLYYTPVNWHLHADEVRYILQDSGARAVIISGGLGNAVREAVDGLDLAVRLVVGGDADGFDEFWMSLDGYSTEALPDEEAGDFLLYSGGTTGRPKGVKRPLTGDPPGAPHPLAAMLAALYSFSSDSTYLCPAPLYHAAPLGWSMGVHRLGGTVVVLEQFDAETCLEVIDRFGVTHAQFVPTMFVRMLKLPKSVRQRFKGGQLEVAVHAAAPCPADVKEAMLEWWGPRIYEYYSATEGNCFCAIGPDEWRQHRGSVGRALVGTVHVLDEDGNELPPREVGLLWVEGTPAFEYHNDADKTAASYNAKGWSTLGDMGYVDEDGYVYLTDRASHTIISGGVNIYPQEVEDLLVLHPEVDDVAVIGVPNEELGEEVRAVVVPRDPAHAGPELEAQLIEACRSRLAHYKCPRAVDFVSELPRLPTGKLRKSELKARYKSHVPDAVRPARDTSRASAQESSIGGTQE